jgi:threonine/homoserine efflux transporter RhtA
MNSATDFSATTALSATTSQRPRTAVYFWVALALLGLAMIGCGVAGSYYMNIIDAPYVGP